MSGTNTYYEYQESSSSSLLQDTYNLKRDGSTDLSASFSAQPASTIDSGNTFTATFTINDSGTIPATGSISARFDLIPTDSATNGGATISGVGSAAASIADDVTTPSPIPISFTVPDSTPPGTYDLVGTLTDGDGITDTDTSDKTFGSTPITISGGKGTATGGSGSTNPSSSTDLSGDFGLPKPDNASIVLAPKEKVAIPTTYSNDSDTTASGTLSVQYYLSRSGDLDGTEVKLGQPIIHDIDLASDGGTIAFNDTLTIPAGVFSTVSASNLSAVAHPWGEYQIIAEATPTDGLSNVSEFSLDEKPTIQLFSHNTPPASAVQKNPGDPYGWEALVQGDDTTYTGSAADLITINEASIDHVYWDTGGHPTIGIGVNLDVYGNQLATLLDPVTAAVITSRITAVQQAWKAAYPKEKLTGKAKDYSTFVANNPGLFTDVIDDDQSEILFNLLLPKYQKIAIGLIGKVSFNQLPANIQSVAVDIAFNRPVVLQAMAADIRAHDYAAAAWVMMNFNYGGGSWADRVKTRVSGDGTSKPGDFHVLMQGFEENLVSYIAPLNS